MHRLFIALRPPPHIRAHLLATMDGVPTTRWQDDGQLHMTLRYIGPVERPVAEDIAAALASLHAPAPHVMLTSVGRFEKRGRTDTLWAGLSDHDALRDLHHKVDQACRRAGIPPDTRAFLPHITVARLSRAAGVETQIARWIADHAGLTSPIFTMPHIVLYESNLGHDGATYGTIARWPLE